MCSVRYSVIIPIYNKSEYLDECIGSILDQKYDDLELLLINDGSTDSSLEICKKYASQYPNIIVIDKPNSGVSNTRNLGIEKSNGQYIIFVDGDDVLANNFFASVDNFIDDCDILLYKSCRKRALLSTDIDSAQNSITLNDKQSEILKSVLYNQHLIKNCNFNFNRVTDYVVSSKLLKENTLLFNPELKVGEDKFFNFRLFQKALNIKCINKCLYYIRTNAKSVMGSYNKDALPINQKLYEAFETELNMLPNNALKEELIELMPCLGYQIVRNSITSNFCHQNNPFDFRTRKLGYKECKKYLNKNAKLSLNSYDKYLFSVFNYPFLFMNIIMKNRLIRGGWYYVFKIFI